MPCGEPPCGRCWRGPSAASSHAPGGGDADAGLRAGYRVQDLDWFDPARDRAVPVKLFWDQLAEASREGEEKYVSRWLNDSDNRAWRTKSGRV